MTNLAPDNAVIASAANRALGIPVGTVRSRTFLHRAPGRAVERLVFADRTMVLKWRTGRVSDREALLYRELTSEVKLLLRLPDFLGATCIEGTHFLFLECVEGTPLDWTGRHHVRHGFEHLGRLHGQTAAFITDAPHRLASQEAHPELWYERPVGSDEDPLVLDPGDLHGENFLLRPNGTVCLVDLENMAVRPRLRALRQLREDPSLPTGEMADIALTAYWAAAGWRGDYGAFRCRFTDT